MKTLYFILVALSLVNGAIGQTSQPCATCLPEGITFTTQAQIDSFQVNYPNCTEIEGFVVINGNDITNLNGLNVVTFIGGSLYIEWNETLTSLSMLENLTSIGGGLSIKGNYTLTNLTGLNSLTSIVGQLYIEENVALTSLTGLNNLTSIGGGLNIFGNDALTSLTGLDNVEANTISELHIYDNPLLYTCDVQSICDYLVAPNGTVEIHDNAAGCNSEGEVEEACGVGVDESSVVSHQSSVNIYPNPASNSITLELPNTATPQKNTTLTINNINGQQLIQRQIMEPQTLVDVSGLSAGVYFVKVVSYDGVMVGKFVKQ